MQNMLSDEDTRAVKVILAEELGTTEDQITPETRIMDDFGTDSLTMVDILMKLEDRFNVSVPDTRWEGVQTVQDLYETLAELLEARSVRKG